MADDAKRWREKYLANIEQQEKLERRWDMRCLLYTSPSPRDS